VAGLESEQDSIRSLHCYYDSSVFVLVKVLVLYWYAPGHGHASGPGPSLRLDLGLFLFLSLSPSVCVRARHLWQRAMRAMRCLAAPALLRHLHYWFRCQGSCQRARFHLCYAYRVCCKHAADTCTDHEAAAVKVLCWGQRGSILFFESRNQSSSAGTDGMRSGDMNGIDNAGTERLIEVVVPLVHAHT